MFKEGPAFASPENQGKRRKEEKHNNQDDNDIDPSRRKFLKLAGAALATFAVGGATGFKMARDKREEGGANNEESQSVYLNEAEPESEGQGEIFEDDAVSIGEIMDFYDQDRVGLNLQKIDEIKKYWKKRYEEDPKLKTSLEEAYDEMGRWQPYLEEIFRRQGVPAEYIFLAIPESHWNPRAVSRVGATGPYQFMKETARMYDLTVASSIDERKDPLKSAEACAKLLKDLYSASGDWSLALSGYNGGYLWKYLKQAKEDGAEISYEGFLKYLEDNISRVKTEVSHDRLYYMVKAGDNLRRIALRSRVGIEELCRINGISDRSRIQVGHKIYLPTGDKERKEIFNKKIAGFSENLNYPAKYWAIAELIKEGAVSRQRKPIKFKEIKVKKTIKQAASVAHRVKKGETLYGISKKYGLKVNELVKRNRKNSRINNIRPGDFIFIPSVARQEHFETLESLADKYGRSVKELEYLNPAVKSGQTAIPAGAIIRV